MKLVNSVTVANKVWQEVKGYSIFPTEKLLRKVVEDAVPEDTPKHVVDNAYNRVWARIKECSSLTKRLAQNHTQSDYERLAYLTTHPIKEGPIPQVV